MQMADMIDERLVAFDLDAKNKEDAIQKVCRMMYDAGKVTDYEAYMTGVKNREKEFETGMGNGIAIPHCKNDCVKDAAFSLIKLKEPIEWGSLDGEPVDYVIMLAAPNSSDNVHLSMLSKLAVSLMDDDFRDSLKDATDVDQIINIFQSRKEE
ncbi:MAG: PTS sugar transporter subunit IIA [Hespellia sp.]|nr:PTS sugar transporter subunit IIA [Hespellia sp.]